ncbi:MAG: hypothetical protein Q4A72_07125 [Bacillota bacterium]|nr:hypothetical protein [Bacillota bacterium]
MVDNKVCKKCGKVLPKGCEEKKCESCRNASIQGGKKIAKLLGLCVGGAYLFKKAKDKIK